MKKVFAFSIVALSCLANQALQAVAQEEAVAVAVPAGANDKADAAKNASADKNPADSESSPTTKKL